MQATILGAMAGELSSDMALLKQAKTFTYGEVLGQATKNTVYAAYDHIRSNLRKLEPSEVENMMTTGTPAGKLFAAALIWETNVANGQPAKMKSGFERLKNDNTKVMYRSGCEVSEETVAGIAKSFLQTSKFADFVLSGWCKKPIEGP